jgi:hypothetical protein
MLLLLKPVEQSILLLAILFVLHHDNLVPDSTELNGVS